MGISLVLVAAPRFRPLRPRIDVDATFRQPLAAIYMSIYSMAVAGVETCTWHGTHSHMK